VTVAGETHEYTDMDRGMAKTAREQGFDEIVVRAGLPLKIAAKN
jgi:rubrerythrin